MTATCFFTHVDPSEDYVLADHARPDRITARIRLGDSPHGWLLAVDLSAPELGRGGPLGFWTPRRELPPMTRDEAFAAAVSEAERFIEHDQAKPIRARVRAWLSALTPEQQDLFAA